MVTHKVIGYFAYFPNSNVFCDEDACIIAGSKSKIQSYLQDNKSPLAPLIKKTTFGEIMHGLDMKAPYAFDEEAYERFLPLARQEGFPIEEWGTNLNNQQICKFKIIRPISIKQNSLNNLDNILSALEFNIDCTFPKNALQEATQRFDEIYPYLIESIIYAKKNAKEILHNKEPYMLHIYSLYLLAQFQKKEAYNPIVEFFSLPKDLSLDLTGDVVTEDLDSILASVCCGDTSLITKLIEDRTVNEYVRNAALRSLVTLVVEGQLKIDWLISYIGELFKKLERKESYIWVGLVNCCLDLNLFEFKGAIYQAFDENLVESFCVTLKDVEQELNTNNKPSTETIKRTYKYRLIKNTIVEMEGWACFDNPEKENYSNQKVNTNKKIGRNEPCPCGSGKKFKKCCLN